MVTYGKRALDNKNQIISVMEDVEHLIKKGFIPKIDIYFAFGFDEEVDVYKGASMLCKYFEEKGIQFECILDEGGAIIEGMI